MVIRISPPRRGRAALVIELVVATAILAAVVLPLAFAFDQERKACRAAYYHAVALEIVDGETEILAAGEWRQFQPGRHDYSVRAAAATNLPPGRFILTVGDARLRLEWKPNQRGRARPVIREVRVK